MRVRVRVSVRVRVRVRVRVSLTSTCGRSLARRARPPKESTSAVASACLGLW